MAFGFFRRHQKVVIIIMVVLMVAFLLTAATFEGIMNLFSPNRNPAAGTMYGEKLTVRDQMDARSVLDLLESLRFDRSMGEDLTGMSGVHNQYPSSEYLLMLLRQNGNRAGDTLALLYREAVHAGVTVSDQEVINAYWKLSPERRALDLTGKTPDDSVLTEFMDRHRVNEATLRHAMAVWLTVAKYFNTNVPRVAPSTPQLRRIFSDVSDKLDLRIVQLPARPTEQNPTDDQIREQFDKHRATPRGMCTVENPFGFGYQVPDMAGLQWLTIRGESIIAASAPTERQITQEYMAGRSTVFKGKELYMVREEITASLVAKNSAARVDQLISNVATALRVAESTWDGTGNLYDTIVAGMRNDAAPLLDRKVRVDFPAVPLAQAMRSLAEQARVDTIVFPADDTAVVALPAQDTTLGGALEAITSQMFNHRAAVQWLLLNDEYIVKASAPGLEQMEQEFQANAATLYAGKAFDEVRSQIEAKLAAKNSVGVLDELAEGISAAIVAARQAEVTVGGLYKQVIADMTGDASSLLARKVSPDIQALPLPQALRQLAGQANIAVIAYPTNTGATTINDTVKVTLQAQDITLGEALERITTQIFPPVVLSAGPPSDEATVDEATTIQWVILKGLDNVLFAGNTDDDLNTFPLQIGETAGLKTIGELGRLPIVGRARASESPQSRSLAAEVAMAKPFASAGQASADAMDLGQDGPVMVVTADKSPFVRPISGRLFWRLSGVDFASPATAKTIQWCSLKGMDNVLFACNADDDTLNTFPLQAGQTPGLMSLEEISKLNGVGDALESLNDRARSLVEEVAMSKPFVQAGQDASTGAMEVGQEGPMMFVVEPDYTSYDPQRGFGAKVTGRLFWRLAAAQPSHALTDAEFATNVEAHRQVVSDWRLLQGYKLAEIQAQNLAAVANMNGLTVAARDAQLTTSDTGLFARWIEYDGLPYRPSTIPGVRMTPPLVPPMSSELHQQILDQAFALAPKGEPPYGRGDVGIIEVQPARVILVAERTRFVPGVESDFQAARSKLASWNMQNALRLSLIMWFQHDVVVKRTGFEAAPEPPQQNYQPPQQPMRRDLF
ncbi:MAG: SurA N-terminal domain-containing protein [Phycisphaerae bacterium]|nr:SurA N-terminal domain-containing protein [Phycisphaerae bacterium]